MKLSIISFTEQGLRLMEQLAGQLEGQSARWAEGQPARQSEGQSAGRLAGQTVGQSAAPLIVPVAGQQVGQPQEQPTGTLKIEEICTYTKWGGARQSPQFEPRKIGEWAGEQLAQKHALLFIGACGIAVRAIAPWITDKLHDSPVLVMDEQGRYVIPILAGHMGGANELAQTIAEKTGAVPVITTATDLNQKFAVDLFAKKNGLAIVNKEGIARVSSKVLAGETVTISVENGHCGKDAPLPTGLQLIPYPPKDKVDILVTSEKREFQCGILLRPREYVIGMGCRKGKEDGKIEELIRRTLQEQQIEPTQVFSLASIDIKKEESGFLAWSRKENIPFVTFSAEQLEHVSGSFSQSEFVKSQVGVDNVCERAALCGCRDGEKSGSLYERDLHGQDVHGQDVHGCDWPAETRQGQLIVKKHAEDGMTIAIAKREWSVRFDEA